VTLPEGLTTIGSNTFKGCTALVSIALPSTILKIQQGAFSGCTALTSVTAPDSVKSLYLGGNDNGGLTTASCPKLNIATQALLRRIKSDTVTQIIANGVTKIKDNEYADDESIGTVIIPDSVTSIGEGAFRNCKNLSSLTIGKNVTSIGKNAFYGSQLTSVIIPDSVTTIGEGVFCIDSSENTKLLSITIGSNVSLVLPGWSIDGSFGGNFEEAYNDNGKQAGTYTRSDTDSETWTRQ